MAIDCGFNWKINCYISCHPSSMRCQFSIWLLKKPEIIFLLKWIALSEMTDSIFHLSSWRSTKKILGLLWLPNVFKKPFAAYKKLKTAYKLKIYQSINDEIEIDSYNFYARTCINRIQLNKGSIRALNRLQCCSKKCVCYSAQYIIIALMLIFIQSLIKLFMEGNFW